MARLVSPPKTRTYRLDEMTNPTRYVPTHEVTPNFIEAIEAPEWEDLVLRQGPGQIPLRDVQGRRHVEDAIKALARLRDHVSQSAVSRADFAKPRAFQILDVRQDRVCLGDGAAQVIRNQATAMMDADGVADLRLLDPLRETSPVEP